MQIHDGRVEIDDEHRTQMLPILEKYRRVKNDNLLLLLPFVTITEYLHSLRLLAQSLAVVGQRALFYLAAAVSDFFIPAERMSEHKIQSEGGGKRLVIEMEPVPKFLRRLTDGWARSAFVVSFKLETDESLLLSKSRSALDKYHHQVVVGNLLQSRKTHVVLVTQNSVTNISTSADKEIEGLLVPEIIRMHQEHQASRFR